MKALLGQTLWLFSTIIYTASCFTWNPFFRVHNPYLQKKPIEKAVRRFERGDGANDNTVSPFPVEELVVTEMTFVKNFRKASGLEFIYRCASTDLLGDLFDSDGGNENVLSLESAPMPPPYLSSPSESEETKDQEGNLEIATTNKFNFENNSPEKKLLYDVGLILDLRSQSERDELKAKKWMVNAPGGEFFVKNFERSGGGIGNYERGRNEEKKQRIVYRIDVLSPQRLFDYMSKTWLSSAPQRTKYMFNAVFNSQGLHEMRMDILNEKGLKGLYEAIIETSGAELFASLKAIVKYLEATQNNVGSCSKRGVVVHCVQGKDRTGLVVMLCQSILGVSDDIIISDYHLSEKLLNRDGSSAATMAASSVRKGGSIPKGKLSREIFSGSPAEVMVSTLKLIRGKYGSINNYLDSIGFDKGWRERFISVSSNKETDWKSTKIQSKL